MLPFSLQYRIPHLQHSMVYSNCIILSTFLIDWLHLTNIFFESLQHSYSVVPALHGTKEIGTSREIKFPWDSQICRGGPEFHWFISGNPEITWISSSSFKAGVFGGDISRSPTQQRYLSHRRPIHRETRLNVDDVKETRFQQLRWCPVPFICPLMLLVCTWNSSFPLCFCYICRLLFGGSNSNSSTTITKTITIRQHPLNVVECRLELNIA